MAEERWHRPDTGKWQPGDNWAICDISGFKVLMSQTKKTWDGLRVHPAFWYPRHPQLDVKAVPDRPGVVDGRPRPPDVFVAPQSGFGSFCLVSPGGASYLVTVESGGTIATKHIDLPGVPSYSEFYLGGWVVTVDDDGVLHVSSTAVPGPEVWYIVGADGRLYRLSVTDAGALQASLV